MVDHCGQGLFHHIAWQNCPIQIITVGVPNYLGIREYLLDIPGTPSPDQQFSRATILAYDGQVAVVRHYPHLISPNSVNTEMSVSLWRGRLPPIGPPSNTAGTTDSAGAICLPPSIALSMAHARTHPPAIVRRPRGISIGATGARARSKSAPAFPSMKIHGAGPAASADFQAWRDERDWTARKYAIWETGERMPSQKPGSLMRYPCGAT